MALTRYTGSAAVGGSLVSVFLSGTQVFATLYEDEAGLTPLANPLTSDTATGFYTFVAEDQAYDVVLGQPDDPPVARTASEPYVVFSGESPDRHAFMVVIDPETQDEVVLAEVVY